MAELSPRDGRPIPYPDQRWNSTRHDPRTGLVKANTIRLGPDGALWIIDGGAPDFGEPAVRGAARLIRVDLTSNTVTRVYPISQKSTSFIDDVRFRGNMAYLTDAGSPGLISLNLQTGLNWRVLDGAPETTARRAMLGGGGRELRKPDNSPVKLHADQIEVSPQGDVVYFSPASGPIFSIDARLLDAPELSDKATRNVRKFADFGTIGGTAMDAEGTLYVSDPENHRIEAISATGNHRTVIADPRLAWPDALWITRDHRLYIPAAQLDRTPGMNSGRNELQFPIRVFSVPIAAGPAPNDHN
ncbi:L-dopachrome tautomerase-related protein [Williamsia sterculiae]|uniref:L-dopachrome tautomerase-related protein n=1 Tax=Williamsia sterculiae TaxID=1344003 RepID=UPI001356409E|nr:L-dopachrome tautomerase-related protein [Williamsia sterculiae]